MQSTLVGAATADVMLNDGGSQAAGAAAAANVSAGLQQAITESAGQVAVATATQVAPQTAESTVRGVAAQAKDSIGTDVYKRQDSCCIGSDSFCNTIWFLRDFRSNFCIICYLFITNCTTKYHFCCMIFLPYKFRLLFCLMRLYDRCV